MVENNCLTFNLLKYVFIFIKETIVFHILQLTFILEIK